jgi:hypothetical protein
MLIPTIKANQKTICQDGGFLPPEYHQNLTMRTIMTMRMIMTIRTIMAMMMTIIIMTSLMMNKMTGMIINNDESGNNNGANTVAV